MKFDALGTPARCIQTPMLLEQSEKARIDKEAGFAETVEGQVRLGGTYEFRLLDNSQSTVATVTQDSAHCAGNVVVIDVGPMEIASADGALSFLRFDHRAQVFWCHSIPTKPETQRSFGVESVSRVISAPLAPGLEAREGSAVPAESIDRENFLAGRACLYLERGLRQQFDLLLAGISDRGATGFTETSDPEAVAWVGVEGREGLISQAARADFHCTDYSSLTSGGAYEL